GIRPHHIRPRAARDDAVPIAGRVLVTELSGSESVVHFDVEGGTWVSQSLGIHPFEVGETAQLFIDTSQCLYFDPDGRRIDA
ncbi:MAG: TOBE domain-containing protein, partial [Inquilinus sp.]|nr:TOBE domain-containing protein [Inquilinus sp.]